MNVSVISRVEDTGSFLGETAVVIDVLRATSTMVTALANGAGGIRPFSEPVQAAAECTNQNGHLLCGERGGVRIEGFHLGNSPLEFDAHTVNGKMLLMSTTNGTRAIEACLEAKNIYIASALNAGAVAERLLREQQPVTIVCAGTKGKFSLDDFAVAGLVASYLASDGVKYDDTALAAVLLAQKCDLHEMLASSLHGRRLMELGFGEDVEYCAQINKFNLVPALVDNTIFG